MLAKVIVPSIRVSPWSVTVNVSHGSGPLPLGQVELPGEAPCTQNTGPMAFDDTRFVP